MKKRKMRDVEADVGGGGKGNEGRIVFSFVCNSITRVMSTNEYILEDRFHSYLLFFPLLFRNLHLIS